MGGINKQQLQRTKSKNGLKWEKFHRNNNRETSQSETLEDDMHGQITVQNMVKQLHKVIRRLNVPNQDIQSKSPGSKVERKSLKDNNLCIMVFDPGGRHRIRQGVYWQFT